MLWMLRKRPTEADTSSAQWCGIACQYCKSCFELDSPCAVIPLPADVCNHRVTRIRTRRIYTWMVSLPLPLPACDCLSLILVWISDDDVPPDDDDYIPPLPTSAPPSNTQVPYSPRTVERMEAAVRFGR